MTINGPAPMILAMYHERCDRPAYRAPLCARADAGRRPERISDELRSGDARTRVRGFPPIGGELPDGHDGSGPRVARLQRATMVIASRVCYEADRIPAPTLRTAFTLVRGTVQADILKEDQAQNTCIFSTEFALKHDGRRAAFFSSRQRDSEFLFGVDFSGYHIAEAGANPVTRSWRSRSRTASRSSSTTSRAAWTIDEFAPNLIVLFLERNGSRIRRHRPGRAAHLGARAA